MLNTSEQCVKEELKDDEPLQEVLTLAKQEIVTLVNGNYYPSKNKRYEQWVHNDDTPYEDLLISILTTTLLNPILTYQSICGMLNHKIPLEEELDRVKTIAEVLAVVSRTGLIQIKRHGAGEKTMVKAGYNWHSRIMIEDRHELNRYPAQEVVEL